MKIGAHVSAAGGLDLSIQRAKDIGADCTQIFVSPPRQWNQTAHSPEIVENYKKAVSESRIDPNFIHGTYLINLGTQDPKHLQKSIDWLIYGMNEAHKLNMTGVIFHTGSDKGGNPAKAIKTILDSSPEVFLILENSAGAGKIIGDKFTELYRILDEVGDPRLKICLDTCHGFAAGYEIASMIDTFDAELGLKNLVAIHANDSKFDLGSNKDRHANIGEGFIGKEGFKTLLNDPRLKDIPFILEVPGFADNGPDKENLEILKSLAT